MGRVVVMLFAALFAAIGIGFWVAPEQLAEGFRLHPVGAPGVISLRADLAGLFVGLALLCFTGALVKKRSMLFAAVVLLGVIVIGRLVGMMAGGGEGQLAMLSVEVAAIAALALYARSLGAPEGAATTALVRRGFVIGGILVAVAAIVVAVLLNPAVEQRVFDSAAMKLTAQSNSGLLGEDALRVGIAGSSAPLPSRRRAKACVAVFAGGKFYVVDVGPESVESLLLWGFPLSSVGGVLLTHFHSDHIGDLGELNLQTWAQGRPAPLAVYGGPGVEQVVQGFNQAYRQDQGYRTTHHTEHVMPPGTWPLVAHTVELDGPPTEERSRTGVILEEGGLRITAIEVNHDPIIPAYAYRFDYKGRSVVVTGDFKVHPPLINSAKGADIMVSEAIARPMVESLERATSAAGRDRQAKIMHDIQDYHISPTEASNIANQAGVKLLVFYHLLPAPDTFLTRRLFGHDVGDVRKGDWVIADDGSLYTLPVGSQEIRIDRLGS